MIHTPFGGVRRKGERGIDVNAQYKLKTSRNMGEKHQEGCTFVAANDHLYHEIKM